jgi:hypothetical protein
MREIVESQTANDLAILKQAFREHASVYDELESLQVQTSVKLAFEPGALLAASARAGQRLCLIAGIARERPTPVSRPSECSSLANTASNASTKTVTCSRSVMSGGRIFSTF